MQLSHKLRPEESFSVSVGYMDVVSKLSVAGGGLMGVLVSPNENIDIDCDDPRNSWFFNDNDLFCNYHINYNQKCPSVFQ